MSTVMGKADKGPIRLVIILTTNQSLAKYHSYLCKLRKIVDCVGTKFAELFLSIREDFEFRGFEITSHHASIGNFTKKVQQMKRDKPDIYLNCFVDKYSKLMSANSQFMNFFLIPEKVMKNVSSDMANEDEWSEGGRSALSELMDHMIHEICHSLGGFHAGEGIMKRHASLLSNDTASIKNIKLSDIIDKKTVTIICESMSIITTFKPQRNLRFVDGEMTYFTDQSIAAVFFANDSHYTETYSEFTYLDACKYHKVNVPEQWDVFVVVHFCGHIFHYSKKDVETSKRCTQVIEF